MGVLLVKFVSDANASEVRLFDNENVDESELITSIDSQEEAEQIAAEYRIEFVSFSDGVAIFKSHKPYSEICEYGKKNGLKELYINRERKLY